MTSDHLRETVVIVGEPESSTALRDALAQQWVVLETRPDGPGPEAEDQVAAAVAPLASRPYGLIGVSSAASVAIRHALRSPETITALILVSPLAVRPAGEPAYATHELESQLAQIQCPTLAVFGQADDKIDPVAPSIYRSRIPQLQRGFRLRCRSRHRRRASAGPAKSRHGLPRTARDLHRAEPHRRDQPLILATHGLFKVAIDPVFRSS